MIIILIINSLSQILRRREDRPGWNIHVLVVMQWQSKCVGRKVHFTLSLGKESENVWQVTLQYRQA